MALPNVVCGVIFTLVGVTGSLIWVALKVNSPLAVPMASTLVGANHSIVFMSCVLIV